MGSWSFADSRLAHLAIHQRTNLYSVYAAAKVVAFISSSSCAANVTKLHWPSLACSQPAAKYLCAEFLSHLCIHFLDGQVTLLRFPVTISPQTYQPHSKQNPGSRAG